MRLLPKVRQQQQTAQKNQQNNLSCFISYKSTTMEIRENFEITAKQRTWSFALIGVGALAFILGFIIKGVSADQHQRDIFWGTIMYNSLFFMLICNASMFFICASTLAMGGWYTVIRRVPEAISSMVPIFGAIAFIVLLYIVFGTHIYPWTDVNHLKQEHEEAVLGKLGFLNPVFFFIWTILAIGLWSLLGWRMRRMSSETDERPLTDDEGHGFVWRNTVNAS